MCYDINAFPVGGCVRDALMGIDPKDFDYVVVGSTAEYMIEQGFKQVGADFPVFLHPVTGEEFALARVERKVAAGYLGFETDANPTITLKEDLSRRDLTINSMAFDENGQVIDYFGGQQDIKDQVLRHTSNAFREDPVRILRIARFAARYNFEVHSSTNDLMIEMVEKGEFDSLVAERVWAEFEKVAMEKYFWKFWCVLEDCGALKRLPFYDKADYSSFECAADAGESLMLRCAAMFSNSTPEEFTENRIPSDISELALVTDKFEKFAKSIKDGILGRQITLKFFESVDLFRRPERFNLAMKTLALRDIRLPGEFEWLVNRAMMVDAGKVAMACSDKSEIRLSIFGARLNSMNNHDCFVKE